jgi:FtsP/CotA-like multicopper oxidase with cupredoxin domain
MSNRRAFFSSLSSLAATALARKTVLAAQKAALPIPVHVTTPDVADLPFTMDNAVKVFHLIAEPVKQVIVPGRTFDLWGFNGTAPGPTIQAIEGERVRIVFDNHLPEPTGIHWHGLELPIEMDGVPGIGQEPVPPGGRFVYEFTLHQNGTFFYHPHMAMQEMVGLLGGFIIHPKSAYAPQVDKDYLIALQEYAVLPNNSIPNSMSMEYNWLTFNGKSGPASTPLVVALGERVRIRLINMGMDHHPVHLHGFTFWETGREGARQQESAWTRGNTTLVGVAQARDIEFVADRAGDWMLHCHLPHHMMNQMASNVGPMTRVRRSMQAGASPNMPGMDRSANEAMAGMSISGLAENAEKIPLFPQDAFMEGQMMAIDNDVEKPETFGLPAGWSGFSGGMMTLVRVMPPDRYDEVMKLKAQQAAKGNAR